MNMKSINCMLLLCLFVFTGCAESAALVRTDGSRVFEELSTSTLVPVGDADLRVTVSLKTHPAGLYSASDLHGTPDYRLLVSIDGQESVLRGSVQHEYSDAPQFKGPETGSGVRYRFAKTMRLKGGLHRITVALPEDKVAVERVVALKGGELNRLVVEPVYGKKPGKKRPGMGSAESFTEGIKTLKLILNGKEL